MSLTIAGSDSIPELTLRPVGSKALNAGFFSGSNNQPIVVTQSTANSPKKVLCGDVMRQIRRAWFLRVYVNK